MPRGGFGLASSIRRRSGAATFPSGMNRGRPLGTAPPAEIPMAALPTLHALAEAINRCTRVDEVYPETLQALRRVVGADRAAILLLDAGRAMRFVAWDGLSDRYRAAVEGHSPWAADEEHAQPLVVREPEREPAIAPLLPVLRAEGIASLAFIPVAHQGRLLGKFMLYFDAPRELSSDDTRLALTVAEYLALAISRQRSADEARQLNVELEQRVRHRTQQLEEANREMEAFCYSVSHDLRAPLRALDGFARILIEDAGHLLDETDKDNLRRIIAASERMARLMDDLLRLSRVGRSSMRLCSTDLSGVVADIVERLHATAPQRRLLKRIAPGLEATADAGLLRIVLENLVGNAWKYTGATAEAQIEFGQHERDGRTSYFIRDNGAGFDMRYAAKLFAPFQRLHSPGEFEGNGIGLAIVQRVLQRHGGRIWAEAQPGRGAAFWFTLWEDGIPAELQPGAAASSRPSSPPV